MKIFYANLLSKYDNGIFLEVVAVNEEILLESSSKRDILCFKVKLLSLLDNKLEFNFLYHLVSQKTKGIWYEGDKYFTSTSDLKLICFD